MRYKGQKITVPESFENDMFNINFSNYYYLLIHTQFF